MATGGVGRTVREFNSCFDLEPAPVSRVVLDETTDGVSSSEVVANERLLMIGRDLGCRNRG